MPDHTRYDEAAEEQDLNHEAANDDVLAGVQGTNCAACHYAAAYEPWMLAYDTKPPKLFVIAVDENTAYRHPASRTI
jgi:hypothetical protein